MFHVVLVNPEIPPNAGNVIRLCANTAAKLHLIEPMGFDLSEARLRRAGMDYAEVASVSVHPDWASCRKALGEARLFALTTRAGRLLHEAAFRPGDAFVFGAESKGLPDYVLAELGEASHLRLPLIPGNRSLNLSNAVAVTVYEAWRQQGFAGGE